MSVMKVILLCYYLSGLSHSSRHCIFYLITWYRFNHARSNWYACHLQRTYMSIHVKLCLLQAWLAQYTSKLRSQLTSYEAWVFHEEHNAANVLGIIRSGIVPANFWIFLRALALCMHIVVDIMFFYGFFDVIKRGKIPI